MSDHLDPFAPETRDNPTGYRTREFTVRAERAGDGADAPLRIAISSETPVERYDWRTDEVYDEILDHTRGGPDLSYVRDGLPFCLDHDIGRQIGLGTTPTVDADGVMRTEVRQGNHPDAAWVFADMAAGIRQKVSIGYWPGTRYTQAKNDRTGRIERRYEGWTLYEASSVAVPADYAVGVGRSASGAAPREQAVNPATTTETQMTVDTTSERGAAPTPDTRAAELAALARDGNMPEKAAEWIVNGTTVEAARKEVMSTLLARATERQPIAAPAPTVTNVKERAEDKPWENPGEFFRAVVSASRDPMGSEARDARLMAARAQNTLIGEEGGFVVPQAVSAVLLEATMTGGEILSRVTTRPVTVGNTFSETVVKEEARTNGSRNGGVRHYWIAEDGNYIESQAATRQIEGKLQKLGALVKLTEEQLQDGPQMESFLNEQVPEELRFGAELAVWEGDGAAKPLGALVSGALIQVPIEASQTIANTAGNIWVNAANMFARMPARMLGGSAWFINQQLWSKILTATAGTSGGSHPMFTPPGRLESAPNGAIYGRPIVPVEYASAEGTVGDFVFANFSDYLLANKGDIRAQSSIHVDFVRDKTALKFTWRMNGMPRTRVPMTPFKGSQTLSPYIALAARS